MAEPPTPTIDPDQPAIVAARAAATSSSASPAVVASERKSTNVGPEGFPQRGLAPGNRPAPAQAPYDDSAASRSATGEGVPLGILPGFATTAEDDGRTWPTGRLKPTSGRRYDIPATPTTRKKIKDPRGPLVGLIGLLIFAFIAAFLAWYAAGPLWMSVGHAHDGVATVVNCPVGGMHRRCADFIAADHAFTARVALLGPDSMDRAAGAKVNAQMVSESASTAYAGDSASLYLRWGPSVVLLVLCGLGIAWATGASRLAHRRARWTARFVSVLAPLLLLAGMLAASY